MQHRMTLPMCWQHANHQRMVQFQLYGYTYCSEYPEYWSQFYQKPYQQFYPHKPMLEDGSFHPLLPCLYEIFFDDLWGIAGTPCNFTPPSPERRIGSLSSIPLSVLNVSISLPSQWTIPLGVGTHDSFNFEAMDRTVSIRSLQTEEWLRTTYLGSSHLSIIMLCSRSA